MSALEPITVDLDALTERHRFELLRLDELNAQHGIAHKREGMAGPCPTVCGIIRNQMEKVADGQETAMITATTKVAMKLARQAWGVSEAASTQIWSQDLTREGRNFFRGRAVDLLTMLDGVLGLVLPVDTEIA
jgi:hypothetical protein